MKKVLVITSHFPPSAHVGAKRIAKFCKYLPQYGWLPIVITRKTSQFHLLDESMSNNIPPDLQVYRVGTEKKIAPKSKSLARLRGRNLLRGILVKAYCFIFFYDYSWVIQSFLQARRIIRKNNIKIVFTTFPNAETLLVGLLLKVFMKIKWVCEFRDPWVLLHPNYKIPFSQRLIEVILEKKIFVTSDHLITVGGNLKGKVIEVLLKEEDRVKVSVIYNGYDTDDFKDIASARVNRKFVMTYLGTWGSRRTPEYFLLALSNTLKENPNMKEYLVVQFIGEFKFDPQMERKIKRIIVEDGLQHNVKMIPFMTHKEGLAQLSASDLLLLIGRPRQLETDNHWVVTSKLFEYLYLGKPILALVPPEGEAAKIIRNAKAGDVVEPTDIESIQGKICELFCRFLEGRLISEADMAYVSQFDRKQLAAQLACIFDGQ